MGLNTGCLQFDLSRAKMATSPSNSAGFVNQISCVRSASGGTPVGAIALGATAGQDVPCMFVPKGASFPTLEDIAAWPVLRHILMGATAASFLLVTGDDRVDPREHLSRQWVPLQTSQRSNVDLRLQRLVTIKSAFGASNSDLARILRVSRTQLYKWLSSDQAVQLETANWKRLADLEQLAKDWNRMSARPLRAFLDEEVASNVTALTLLSSVQLDMRTIRTAMGRLAALPIDMSTRDAKLRASGILPRPPTGALPRDE